VQEYNNIKLAPLLSVEIDLYGDQKITQNEIIYKEDSYEK
jgi:hypothetical protein